MKLRAPASLLLAFSLTLPLATALLPVIGFGPRNEQDPFDSPELRMQNPESSKPNNLPSSQAAGDVPIVSDSLSVQREVSIFAETVRGVHVVEERLDDKNLNTTVLAPLNSAMARLPRKPWEDPDPENNVQGAFAGLDGEKRAASNLERFAKAHMIPVSPFNENEKVQTLEGTTVWWSTVDGVPKIFPGGIPVKEIKRSVPNGQVWTIAGVINYARVRKPFSSGSSHGGFAPEEEFSHHAFPNASFDSLARRRRQRRGQRFAQDDLYLDVRKRRGTASLEPLRLLSASPEDCPSPASTSESEETSRASLEPSDNQNFTFAAVPRDGAVPYPSPQTASTPQMLVGKMQRFSSSSGVEFANLPPTPDSLRTTPGFSLDISRKRRVVSPEIPSSGEHWEEGEDREEEGSVDEEEEEEREEIPIYEDGLWEDLDDDGDDLSSIDDRYDDEFDVHEDEDADESDDLLGIEEDFDSLSSADEVSSEGAYTPKIRAKLEASPAPSSPLSSPSSISFPSPAFFSEPTTDSTLLPPSSLPLPLHHDNRSSCALEDFSSSIASPQDYFHPPMARPKKVARKAATAAAVSPDMANASRSPPIPSSYTANSSIPTDITREQYAKECIKAAFNSRLSAYNLHEDEYKILSSSLNQMHVTTYLNIRNGILRLWLKDTRVRVTKAAAAGCAKNERFFGLAEVAYDWLTRYGYINHGCLEPSEAVAAKCPFSRTTRRKRTIAIVGAGVSGLAAARQLEALLAQNGESATGADAPDIVVFEGRKRLGGRVFSRALSPGSSDLPNGLPAAIDVGGQIVMGYEGNPLAALIQQQLEIPYHAIDATTAFPLYDVDGKVVDDGRDQMIQDIHDDILDRLAVFKSKPPAITTAQGNYEKINCCKDPSGDGGKPLAVAKHAADQAAGATASAIKLPSSKTVRKRIGKRKAAGPADGADRRAAKKIKLVPKQSNKEALKRLHIEPQQVRNEDGNGSLGKSMDEMFPSYAQVLEPDARDLRLYSWYHANLEYCNASAVDKPSLENWDQDDGNEFTGAHSMIVGGYTQLAKGLYSLPSKLDVRVNHQVEKVRYDPLNKEKGVTLKFKDGSEFSADKVIITLPLGVLKQQSVTFEPPLPEPKRSAIDRLGFGLLNKVIMVYDQPFWDVTKDGFGCLQNADGDEHDLASYGAKRGRFYMWWNASKVVGRPTLVGLMVGEAAEQIENEPNNVLIEEATGILKRCFGDDKVPDAPEEVVVTRWRSDPFACGTYSYIAAGSSGADYDTIAEPMDHQIFFAGEHTNRHYPATVHGAYISGLRAAGEVTNAILGNIGIPKPLIHPRPRLAPQVITRTAAAATLISTIRTTGITKTAAASTVTETKSTRKTKITTTAPEKAVVVNTKPRQRKRKAEDKLEKQDPKKARTAAEEEQFHKLVTESIGPKPLKPKKATANPFLIYQKTHFSKARDAAHLEKQHRTGDSAARAGRDEVRVVLGRMWRDEAENLKAPLIKLSDENKLHNRKIDKKYKEDLAEYERKYDEFLKTYGGPIPASVVGSSMQAASGNVTKEISEELNTDDEDVDMS
ncbi:hypothetical protein Dda_7616 [Drechslerella dactyloides]|uniref:SWIRM domain-containing protein n=1 Tax=Drechslerella dactyloides TaxID=74499 RepID=A0AAD6NH08_DREDA|nr:hypothetical protein Dda_7616 [Drechslerella dactyloides]